jgi:hypothetical protein
MRSHFLKTLDGEVKFKPEQNIYLFLWYGCLYVVAEGWRRLGLSDPTVDALLDREKLGLLKGVRDDVFHYQPEYQSSKTLRMMQAKGFVEWVHAFHDAFSAYFLAWLKSVK